MALEWRSRMSLPVTRDWRRCSGATFFRIVEESDLKLKRCRREAATAQEACQFGMNVREDLILAHKP